MKVSWPVDNICWGRNSIFQ